MTSKNKGVLRRVLAAIQSPAHEIITTSAQLDAYLSARADDDSGQIVNADTAMRVSAVNACVRILSESVGMLPAALYKRDGAEYSIAVDDPIQRLITHAPTDAHGPYEFFRLMVRHLCLRGNFYARIVRAPSLRATGALVTLDVLNPTRVKPRRNASGRIEYVYKPDAQTERVFAAADILHVRGASDDGLEGMSVIEAAARAIGVTIATERYGARLFRNGALHGGILKHPGNLSKEAIERLKMQVSERHSGIENAHKPMLLEEGMEWEAVDMTGEEAQFIESRRFSRSDIAMFFGIPPHMLGDVEKSTSWGSGIEQQGIGFVTYTLLPWLTLISQALVRALKPEAAAGEYLIKFDTEPLTRADFAGRQSGLNTMYRAGVINTNEWRHREGLNPREGGDEYAADASLNSPGVSDPTPNDPAHPVDPATPANVITLRGNRG